MSQRTQRLTCALDGLPFAVRPENEPRALSMVEASSAAASSAA